MTCTVLVKRLLECPCACQAEWHACAQPLFYDWINLLFRQRTKTVRQTSAFMLNGSRQASGFTHVSSHKQHKKDVSVNCDLSA